MSGCLCIHWLDATGSTAYSFQRIMLRRGQTAAVGLCRGVYVFIARVQPVLRHTLSSGLCTDVCRQPQWVYVGVFMYSLAGWSRFYGILFPADYAPAWADSRSGFMSGCLCIHWLGGAGSTAYSFQRIMLRRMQTAAVGLCRGVYVLIVRVKPVLRTELYLIIHAEMPLRLFMDFSAGSLCIFKRNITASQEKLYLILRAALTPT